MEHDFHLDGWVVSPKLNSLRRADRTVRVEPKVMQVLVCLAQSPEVVSKEKLMRTVWADTFVTDDVLTRSISELRKALDDDRKNPRYIQTIPKGGYRLLAPVAKAKPAVSNPATGPTLELELPKPTRVVLPAALAIALALLVGAYAVGRYNAKQAAPTGRAMLAVLPFRNLNNDSQQEFFADGLTAEMISQFGRLPSDRLGVIAWTSMEQYKGTTKSEDQIGNDLGANYLLEGSVRRSGNQVRVMAELVQTGKREHLWSNSYTGDLDNVLELQSRVAREIASEILVQLSPQEQARFSGATPVNGAGYVAYLKAKADSEVVGGTRMGDKLSNLQQAMKLNPGYPPPYVEMAMSYRQLASQGFADPKSSYEAARSLISQALQLDPNSAPAHRELGWIDWRYEWNFAAADKEFRKSLELNPNDAGTEETYALFLKSAGSYNEALAHSAAGRELNPMGSFNYANAGSLLALMKRYDEAEKAFARAVQYSPHEAYVYERLGPVYAMQGKYQAAIEALEKARDYSGRQQDKLAWLGYVYAKSGRKSDALQVLGELSQQREHEHYVSPLHVALIYNGLGDHEQTLAWLEKAYASRDEYLVYLKIYPEFENLHSDPGFQDILRRIGLTN